MRYRFTLLKDLPEHRAGSTWVNWDGFTNIGPIDKPRKALRFEPEGPDNHEVIYSPVGDGLFYNQEWFKQEIAWDKLTDMACPNCRETRMDMNLSTYKEHDYDCCKWLYYPKLTLECPSCGNIREF